MGYTTSATLWIPPLWLYLIFVVNPYSDGRIYPTSCELLIWRCVCVASRRSFACCVSHFMFLCFKSLSWVNRNSWWARCHCCTSEFCFPLYAPSGCSFLHWTSLSSVQSHVLCLRRTRSWPRRQEGKPEENGAIRGGEGGEFNFLYPDIDVVVKSLKWHLLAQN